MSYSRLAALGWTSGVDEGLEQIVETEIKYAGYIQKQQREVERFRKLEAKRLPEWLNYGEIEGLSREAREKLTAGGRNQSVRPPGLPGFRRQISQYCSSIWNRKDAVEAEVPGG